MKADCDRRETYYSNVALLIGEYAGVGASLDQVRKVFTGAGFKLLTISEVQDCA
jgi:hypothetical protein